MRSPVDLRDVVVFGGLGLMGYGLWVFRPWVSFAVCGAVLIALGFIPVARGRVQRGNHR